MARWAYERKSGRLHRCKFNYVRDMTADIITVDIALRNLAGRRDCCAEFSTCEIRGSQLSSYRVEWGPQTWFASVLLHGKSNFVERFSLRLLLLLSLPLSLLNVNMVFTCEKEKAHRISKQSTVCRIVQKNRFLVCIFYNKFYICKEKETLSLLFVH